MTATCDRCGATLPHITLAGPGRCTECSFHVPTQGHRECCSGTAPVQPDESAADNRSFITRVDAWKVDRRNGSRELFDRLKSERAGRDPRSTQPQRRTDPAAIAQPGTNPAYVAAAIRADLEKLAAATEGVRNHTLHAVAANVFEFVKGGHVKADISDELERIAAEIGLHSNEIRATLRSAWQRVGPRTVPAPAGARPAYSIESPTP